MLLKGPFETLWLVWTTENLAVPITAFSLYKHSNSEGEEGDFNLCWNRNLGFVVKISSRNLAVLWAYSTESFLSDHYLSSSNTFSTALAEPNRVSTVSSASHYFLSCCFIPPAIIAWVLESNWQHKQTQFVAFQMPPSVLLVSVTNKGMPGCVRVDCKPWLPH